MEFRCPYCTKELHFMDIQMSKDLNYVFNALTTHDAIKRHSSAVMGYVCLFGVTPFHIKAAKFRRIMEEMVKLFDAQAFSFQKKTYPISHAGIVEALDVCIKRNFNEILENHNYLKKVMIGISEREAKEKSIRGEKKLREQEDLSSSGYTHPKKDIERAFSPEDIPEGITEEQRQQNIARVSDIIKSISGKAA